MKCVIRGNNIEVTKAIKNYIEEKLSKLDKYYNEPSNEEAKVLLEVKGINQKVEVTINSKKYFIRAEEVRDDLYTAIDIVEDKLERQFRKYKTKILSKNKKEEIDFEDPVEDIEEIVRRKKLELKPMSENEAITQMELLGHSFFVFKDSETNTISVLYKRKDSKYGVLEIK